MNKKLKAIILSVCVIALCVSLIAGATFALFSSESGVNIAVTSANVKVVATVTDVVGNMNNGGTAVYSNGTLAVNQITPGDSVSFKISVDNTSDIATMQKFSLSVAEAEQSFASQFIVGIKDENATEYEYYSSLDTGWCEFNPQQSYVKDVVIELPAYIGNDWQQQSCNFKFAVSAVQKNGQAASEESAVKAYIIDVTEYADQAEAQVALNSVIANAADGETIILNGGIWESATFAYEDEKELSVRGYKINNLTINAPLGTLNYYNDVANVNIVAVKGSSAHFYGAVSYAIVKQGRMVLESSATVNQVVIAPEVAEAEAVVVVSAGVKTAAATVVSVEPKIANAKASLQVEKNAEIPTVRIADTAVGNVAIANNGVIENYDITQAPEEVNIEYAGSGKALTKYARTGAEFLAAASTSKAGETIHVINDIDIVQSTSIKIAGGVIIDLHNHTMNLTTCYLYFNNAANCTSELKNGTIIGTTAQYIVVQYVDMKVENLHVTTSGAAGKSAYFVYMGGSGKTLEIESCDIAVSGTASVYGVNAAVGNVTLIVKNSSIVATGTKAYAVYASKAAPHIEIENSTLDGGMYGMYLTSATSNNVLNVKDSYIYARNSSSTALGIQNSATVTLDNTTVESTDVWGNGIVFGAASTKYSARIDLINNCQIRAGYYAFFTNAKNPNEIDVNISGGYIGNTNAGGGTGMVYNIAGSLIAQDVTFKGVNQALFFRSGNAISLENCKFISDCWDQAYPDYAKISISQDSDLVWRDIDAMVWGQGNENVPYGALVIGTHPGDSGYPTPAIVNIINCQFELGSEEAHNYIAKIYIRGVKTNETQAAEGRYTAVTLDAQALADSHLCGTALINGEEVNNEYVEPAAE